MFLGGIISNNGGQLIKDKVAVLGDNSKVALMGPDGFNTTDTITDAGAASEGMYFTIGGSSPNDLKNAAGKAFVAAFKKTYKVSTLQAYTGYGAEAMQVLMAAIAKSNGTRASVVKSLYGLKARTRFSDLPRSTSSATRSTATAPRRRSRSRTSPAARSTPSPSRSRRRHLL